MSGTIKAIETAYNGYLFRSRTEARWAVFFDAMGIPYQYEKEGFDLDGIFYLPDFWLPDQKMWLEIKPDQELKEDEREKVIRFAGVLPRDVSFYVLAGTPGFSGPDADHSFSPDYAVLHACCFDKKKSVSESTDTFWTICPLCGHVDIAECNPGSIQNNGERWDGLCCYHCDYHPEDRLDIPLVAGTYFHEGWVHHPPGASMLCSELRKAYAAARSARFEHGQTPDSPLCDLLTRCLECLEFIKTELCNYKPTESMNARTGR
jgi:hypothetical protein